MGRVMIDLVSAGGNGATGNKGFLAAKRGHFVNFAGLLSAAYIASCSPATRPQSAAQPSARQVHERLLVLDTHLDTALILQRRGWDIAARHAFEEDQSQVDLPRMADGGLDGGWWVIWTRQGPLTQAGYAEALATARGRHDALRRMLDAHGDRIALATRSGDAEFTVRAGKRIAYLSIENSYPLGTDIANARRWYDAGVRMLGLVHSKNNQFADSGTDTPVHGGLSPLGRRLIGEANRLGMMVDMSHSSDAALSQAIALSKAPIILSHAGPDAIFEHGRNIPDALMRRLAASGGVMHMNTLYLEPLPSTPRADALTEGLEGKTPAEQAAIWAEVRKLAAAEPPRGRATFDQFMAALLHALKVMGPDHVGIGADWDGGGGVAGLMDVAAIPKITERLLAAGYSEEDCAKIWGGNALRVLRAAERARTAR